MAALVVARILPGTMMPHSMPSQRLSFNSNRCTWLPLRRTPGDRREKVDASQHLQNPSSGLPPLNLHGFAEKSWLKFQYIHSAHFGSTAFSPLPGSWASPVPPLAVQKVIGEQAVCKLRKLGCRPFLCTLGWYALAPVKVWHDLHSKQQVPCPGLAPSAVDLRTLLRLHVRDAQMRGGCQCTSKSGMGTILRCLLQSFIELLNTKWTR